MAVKAVLTQTRYMDCPVYWLPEEQSAAWEDRDNLVDLPAPAIRAFQRLVRAGADPKEITNSDLAEVLVGQLGPVP